MSQRDSSDSTPEAHGPPVERGSCGGDEEAGDAAVRWMLAFRDGDPEAFDRIVDKYQRVVLRFIARTVRDVGRAEDLTQEVFVRVFKSRDRYQPSARFKTWLLTIATRLVLNEIRGEQRRRRVFASTPTVDRGGGLDFWSTVPERSPRTPEARLADRELALFLDRVIAALPENQRAALELQRSSDMSYREIASALDVTEPAVKSLLVRAREKLRIEIERYTEGSDVLPLP